MGGFLVSIVDLGVRSYPSGSGIRGSDLTPRSAHVYKKRFGRRVGRRGTELWSGTVDEVSPSSSADRPTVLVSACLLGVACTHRGESRSNVAIEALKSLATLIGVCPEVAGGLPTPRPRTEYGRDGRVRTAAGEDLTEFYERGADQAVALARMTGARRAILKARSPSCGSRQIYDGSHSGVLVGGEGVTAAALRNAGVTVISDEDL